MTAEATTGPAAAGTTSAEAVPPVEVDPFAARYARRATGVLARFNEAGVLASADVHVAATLGRLGGETDERVLLAAALAVRAVRHGSVCLDLHEARQVSVADVEEPVDLDTLPWPETDGWYAACRGSALVAVGVDGERDRPLRLVGDLLYLDRYWRQEQVVRTELDARDARPRPEADPGRLADALSRLFRDDAGAPDPAPHHQRLAAAAVATGWVTVVAGGPGTGKTTTVARILALLHAVLDRPPRVALAAPTGKAAARLSEAISEVTADLERAGHTVPRVAAASTLHRLLGFRPGSHSRFKHDRGNHLPYDVVVVDETSMVSLTLMSRLLEAVRPDARLVLVGDPDQLASVEAGAVLGDLVQRPAPEGTSADTPGGASGEDPRSSRLDVLRDVVPDDLRTVDGEREEVEAEVRADVVRLRRPFRYGGTIQDLAEAIRHGDDDAVLAALRRDADDVDFREDAGVDQRVPTGLDTLWGDVEDAGRDLAAAARAGDPVGALEALDRHRLLCAHRQGPYGVARWGAEVQRRLSALVDGYGADGEWYVGRPLLVTHNDYEVGLFNGDTGVVVDGGERGPVAVFGRGPDAPRLPTTRLSAVETVHAMTVHRAQGSQFSRVSVVLPPEESPLLTRELLYTAVTRARHHVRVVGTEAAVRAAVTTPVVRASGLRRALPGRPGAVGG